MIDSRFPDHEPRPAAPDAPMPPWPRLSGEVVGRYRIFDIVEERFARPGTDRTHPFLVILARDWANVVPVTPEGKVVLIRQFRPGSREVTIEIPGGVIESAETDPAAAALRELEEETGYRAEGIAPLLAVRPNPAIQRNTQYSFIAWGCRPTGRTNPDEAEEVAPFEATWDEIDAMIDDGRIDHALILPALLRARGHAAARPGRTP
jgi:8-oxo-dGTP pyrophosphatase MutT (NUDIX family)